MRNIKLYNAIFPIWLLILYPWNWLVVLPANFIIDSLVVLIVLKLQKQKNIFKKYKSVIIRVWEYGFCSDFIGVAILFITSTIISLFVDNSEFLNKLCDDIYYNPFGDIYAFLITVVAIAVTAIFIYLFNIKVCLKKLDIKLREKRQIAVSLAVLTAPYLFLIPYDTMQKLLNLK